MKAKQLLISLPIMLGFLITLVLAEKGVFPNFFSPGKVSVATQTTPINLSIPTTPPIKTPALPNPVKGIYSTAWIAGSSHIDNIIVKRSITVLPSSNNIAPFLYGLAFKRSLKELRDLRTHYFGSCFLLKGPRLIL